MLSRRPSLILTLALLPALFGCSDKSATREPISQTALSAIAAKPDAPRELLARAVDDLFTDPAMGETRAFLILHNGRIVAERYAEGYNRDSKLVGWSMSKSITGVMIGLLVADGRLALDKTAPIPMWQRAGDPRGEITLKQLLQMRSGLRHVEQAQPVPTSDTVRMLFLDGRDDMAAYAEAQPLQYAAGSKWLYSTETTVILADLAARVLTDSPDPTLRRQAVAEYLHTRLFDPLGMHSMRGEFDAAGSLIGGSLIHGTARDWAKFGEFLRNMGSVRGAQILPRDWVTFMTTPNPHNPGYGAQLWLNYPQSDGSEVLFPRRAPENLFACLGHGGQYVIVSPNQHLTIVRLGKTDEDKRGPLREKLADITEMFESD
ncbi:MAG: hypothetical protein RLY97_1301 [Pseudomonadota bacterium]|jgi:CubicO group peptidase (beta-lactamase class C family)